MEGRPQDRIRFENKKEQIKFLKEISINSGLNSENLAACVGKSGRALRDWARGKYAMPYDTAVRLSQLFGVPLPVSAKKEKWGSHLKEASRKGGKAHLERYGRVKVDQKKREQNWRLWWGKEGRFKDHPIINKPLPFKKPDVSKELAEFIGIVLGDGHISKRQITIFLHREDDKEFGKYVSSLAKRLFNVPIGIYENKNFECTSYVISRTDAVRFFTNKLGMKIGSKVKQQVDIPKWIKKDKDFSKACVRGLMDTDGCFFQHKYRVRGKLYSYNKILFTSRSAPLLKSVFEILRDNRIKSRRTKRYDIWLDSKASVEKYLDTIGSNNPKHLNRHSK